MRSRISLRLGVLASAFLCTVAACTGDDEIYAVPRDAGPAPDGPMTSSGGPSSSSSSGGTGTPDGATNNDAATDAGNDGATNDGGDGGATDGGTDGSVVVDSGVDSGPVVCTTVPCAGNATCTALGCGTCNLGLGFCKQ